MKKQVFLFLVLAVLVAGGVFAQSVSYTFDNSGYAVGSIRITTCEKSGTDTLKIAYSSPAGIGRVKFEFKVYYNGGTRSFSNVEFITTARNNSTFYINLTREQLNSLQRVEIKATWQTAFGY